MIKTRRERMLSIFLSVLCLFGCDKARKPLPVQKIPEPSVHDVKDKARPEVKPIVEDHGVFDRKHLRVNLLQFKTAGDKYVLDFGPIKCKPDVTHKFTIKDLPAGYVLGLGFGLKSQFSIDEPVFGSPGFRNESGIKRLSLKLSTEKGVVVMDKTFDTQDSFNVVLPSYAGIETVITFVCEGSRTDWRFQANTASGSQFVAARHETYILEVKILELLPESQDKSMRVMIRSL